MRWKVILVLVLAVGTISLSKDNPAPAPKAAEPLTPDQMQEKVLPDLDLQAVPLKDFLDFVHDLVPGFQTVIVRDANVPADYPVIPDMKLKKVTLGQVLSIIQEAYPSIEYHPVEAEKGTSIFLFKIHDTVGGDVVNNSPPQTMLRIYRLAEAIDALEARGPKPADAAARAAADKAALDNVLSLVKAALAQAGDAGVNAVVQVHEETQTLLVRGSNSQISAVQGALDALTPTAASAAIRERVQEAEHRAATEQARSAVETDQLKSELLALRAEVQTMRDELVKHQVEEERLKIRLEAAKKSPDAKE